MPKRIAVLVTHNFDDQEYFEPVEAFRAASHSICNIDHEAGTVIYGREHTASVTIDESVDQICVDDFDALLIPGGESPLSFTSDAVVLKLIQEFNAANKTIFSICDGSLLLGAADVLKDRIITSIRDHAHWLQDAGGRYYDVELVNDNNQLISSRAPDDLPVFIDECLEVLRS
ncbi:peptidase [Acinetobacter sp. LoGeW2-3]|uniref:DJ-1/PfpI family protein n=1 Tax=Acinetobacter sp. LoGeW2-3 TaxID=1808001 RepID=UPI000C05991B|nr:DJ-1/PfpI family protein [Acinetobacter sp. LoGeW2-3]ATO20071.1 peptidase [Acinetobacter sp. LoGeW2-3]